MVDGGRLLWNSALRLGTHKLGFSLGCVIVEPALALFHLCRLAVEKTSFFPRLLKQKQKPVKLTEPPVKISESATVI